MSKRIDLFDSTYTHFTEQVLNAVRKETFVEDIGQDSWMTVVEKPKLNWPQIFTD